jgi:hypothetical protein
MIETNEWITKGFWGDANTPDLSAQRTRIFGVRYVPGIGFNEAIELLGGVTDATVWWRWNEKKDTSLQMFSRIEENDPWDERSLGSFVPGIGDMKDRSLFLKVILTSMASDIESTKIPALTELAVVMLNRNNQKWATWDANTLMWS